VAHQRPIYFVSNIFAFSTLRYEGRFSMANNVKSISYSSESVARFRYRLTFRFFSIPTQAQQEPFLPSRRLWPPFYAESSEQTQSGAVLRLDGFPLLAKLRVGTIGTTPCKSRASGPIRQKRNQSNPHIGWCGIKESHTLQKERISSGSPKETRM
jgi:hypothetical protein